MEEHHMQETYRTASPRLMRTFNWVLRRLRSSFAAEFGEHLADEITNQSGAEFQKILPQIPYIGGLQNPFTPILYVSGGMLAISRVMKANGKTAEEMFVVFHKAIDRLYRFLPNVVMRLFGRVFLSRHGGIGVLRRIATRSQKRLYPEDWVFTVVEGDGENFNWKLEYTECAVIKFWMKQGANDLMPYCNFGDMAMSRALGLGMQSATLGEGCESCVAELKYGRETETRAWIPH
jgi:hypothetical protein